MTGLADARLRAFSKRTAQIEAHLAATGEVPADARPACRPTRRPAWPPGPARTAA